MKKSRYNIMLDSKDNKKIIFNSSTCALAEINDDFFKVLTKVENDDISNLNENDKEIFENMKLGGFIVDDDLDEINLLKYKNNFGKFNQYTLGLTIAPTLLCNFRCTYCYETPKSVKMSDEVKNAIIDYVKESSEYIKELSITWYGGEPLLRKDIIEELSQEFIKICEEKNIKYSAFIITNGYLLDDETIQFFKKYKINGAQITIDGPEAVHNSRRVVLSGADDSFKRAFNALKLLKQNDIYISFRVNIDKTNIKYMDELFDILEKNDLKISIGFGQVTPYTDICKSISDTCYMTPEFSDVVLDLQKNLNKRGFKVLGYPYYPGIKMNYCCADHINSFVIDPEGYMYKCWNEVGNKDEAVGNITTVKDKEFENYMINRRIKYMTWSPFENKECLECNILPICMGGCPYYGIKETKHVCEKWKYNLLEVLKYTHEDYYNDTEKYEKILNSK